MTLESGSRVGVIGGGPAGSLFAYFLLRFARLFVNSDGDVVIKISATGAPGWYYIDLYPTFYRNKDYNKSMELPFLFRHAMLSWQDHPQPFVFRYAFKIVK